LYRLPINHELTASIRRDHPNKISEYEKIQQAEGNTHYNKFIFIISAFPRKQLLKPNQPYQPT
ncbi:hypothetical protein, partial [Pelagicoccus sp. SDUM812002]|uniref:hypothetical protein n=1 Tax=Pelagicoccus sp. SDUM812002 TaxID=3041266 RepID=UPI00280E3427